MGTKRNETRFTLRVYSDTDPVVYAWLKDLDAQHLAHGGKLQKVREALLVGIQGHQNVSPIDTVALNLDGLADTLLAQIRPVVEAAVTSALQGLQLSAAPMTGATDAAATEDDTFTDLLFANLTLEE